MPPTRSARRVPSRPSPARIPAAVFFAVLFAFPLVPLIAPAVSPAEAHAQTFPGDPREALATGYLALELALRDSGRSDPASREAANRAFDQVTLQFFAGRFPDALAGLEALRAQIEPGVPATARLTEAAEILRSLNENRLSFALPGGGNLAYTLHLPVNPDGSPRTAPDGGWPTVLALHGAGGDERMFMGGYGAGRIRALGDSLGLAVLAPAALGMLTPDGLRAFLDHAAGAHGLSTGQVVVLGHSAGAALTARLTLGAPERVAGAVCIAGTFAATAPVGENSAPWLIAAPALDPIIAQTAVLAGARALEAQGGRVEIRTLDHEGHTLVVGEFLPEAMRWARDRLRGGGEEVGEDVALVRAPPANLGSNLGSSLGSSLVSGVGSGR
jgi:predicted esterase